MGQVLGMGQSGTGPASICYDVALVVSPTTSPNKLFVASALASPPGTSTRCMTRQAPFVPRRAAARGRDRLARGKHVARDT